MASIRIRFDLRRPPFATVTVAEQYRAFLEMCDWADGLGIAISIPEHHGDPAGYLSAPVTVAAAVLARTRHVPVSVLLLAPFHDPVRLAEELAAIDCMAPGRLRATIAGGYRRAEFVMAGIDHAKRSAYVEETITTLRAAWTGEPFMFRGREVLVTPAPATPGGPLLFAGGKNEVGARRAARLRCVFRPSVNDPKVIDAYFDECEKVGFEGSIEGRTPGKKAPGFVMVSRDPKATWDVIEPFALYDAQTYAAWQSDGIQSDLVVRDANSWQDLAASGSFAVVTPDECVELLASVGSLTLHPLMGGIEPELAWESLRLFEHEVLPRLSVDLESDTSENKVASR